MATVNISGELFIGASRVRTTPTFQGVAAATGEMLQPAFSAAGIAEVDRACQLAWHACEALRSVGAEKRAAFLERIADEIAALGDQLLERAHAESGLPLARLTGERGRTMGQLRLFASELRLGGWLGVRIDPALPDRKPLPRSDLRQRRISLGPVAVFGASNFPLAFSVAGGDTAAALAAGCPVVAKGHPAHPGTCELIAHAIVRAVRACELPEGVFSLLNGTDNSLGAAIVAHPHIKAVGFTGSRAGGLALMKIASERAEPIPVYAEMSSVNPVVLLPGALQARAAALGKEFIASLTLGSGQFCTNPGLLLALDSPELDRFIVAATETLSQVAPTVMLAPSIYAAFESGVAALLANDNVSIVARGTDSLGKYCGRGALFTASADALLKDDTIAREVFGASSVIVRCASERQLIDVLEKIDGQLTATLQLEANDYPLASRLLPILERRAGRILANGWPTGVEVTHAMVHGGPYPATSDGRSTSVGTLAIERFLRPVCYQDVPDALLPTELQRTAALSIPHRFDGEFRSGIT